MPTRRHDARLGADGRVTLPAAIRRLLGVRPGDAVAFVAEGATVRVGPATTGADPFACFGEWVSDADRAGYGDL